MSAQRNFRLGNNPLMNEQKNLVSMKLPAAIGRDIKKA
jgi:hypothetical protein